MQFKKYYYKHLWIIIKYLLKFAFKISFGIKNFNCDIINN